MPEYRGLFDTYNARFLDPPTVGRSFIAPQSKFEQLCRNEHSILIGPRGSGKTTLLKMLRLSALRAWESESKEKLIRELPFTAIYMSVSSDWDAFTTRDYPSEARHAMQAVRDSLITTYAQYAMTDTLEECLAVTAAGDASFERFYVYLSRDDEVEIARALSDAWRLTIRAPSLLGVRLALNERLSVISDISARLLLAPESDEVMRDYPFLSLRLVNAVRSFIDIVNYRIDQPKRVWALCIDELDIVSDEVQSALVRALRSSDDRIRFKLALSPFTVEHADQWGTKGPMGGHDFTPIPLTYHRKHEAFAFSRQMLCALSREYSIEATPEEILGPSPLEMHEDGWDRHPYRPGGARYRQLKQLEQEDPGFRTYLAERGLEHFDAPSENKRAEIRKLIQIAIVRREFGRESIARGSRRVGRSRKRVSDIYTGYQSLLTLCEGNPRWLIGLFRPLLENYRKSGGRVSRSLQARSVSTAIARYMSLLSTIPLERIDGTHFVSVTSVIDKVGSAFFDDIMQTKFKPEPFLSLQIDERVGPAVVEAIGRAVNQGAFVFIPSQHSEYCMGDIRGKRFRLSYLLCARYNLPLVYGTAATLSRVLGGRQATAPPSQLSLEDLF